MATADNLAIKIPETHYVGFQKRTGDEVPLGFMTPDGTDKASMKRKATVDSWANGYGYSSQKQATLPAKTLENKPMVGFKIAKLVAGGGRGWDARSDAWRIEDPRGFELEIGSGNFQEILEVTTVERGEILEECIWGRLGNNNILIPVTSDVYTRAVANTERMGKKSTIREAKPGYHLIFQNGDEATYMGKTFASGYSTENIQVEINPRNNSSYYGFSHGAYSKLNRELKAFNDKAIHTYILLKKDGTPQRIMMRDSLKLSEVREGPELTQAEACEKLNTMLIEGVSWDIPQKYNDRRVFQFSPERVKNFDDYQMDLMELGDHKVVESILKKDAEAEYDYITSQNNRSYIVKTKEGEYARINISWYDTKAPLSISHVANHHRGYNIKLNEDALLNEKRMERIIVKKEVANRGGWFNSTQLLNEVDTVDIAACNLADLTFYKLVGKFKTFSGKDVIVDHTAEL